MEIDAVLLAFAHLLVFAYWLGGDIGAFAASYTITNAAAAPPARLAAANILNTVDMAPRSALILAAPTGVSLAASNAWLSLAPEAIMALWLLSLVWLALIWRLHLTHAPATSIGRRLDLSLRWGALGALLAAAAFGEAPLFIRAKLGLLALAIALGLFIRAQLAGMSAGFASLARGEPGTREVAAMVGALSRARAGVVAIWLALAAAALLGVAKPV